MEYSSDLFNCAASEIQDGKLALAREDCGRFAARLKKLRPLDLLEFGQYQLPGGGKPTDVDVRAPISWLVMARQDNRLLLLSQRCLDWEFFDGSGTLFSPCPAAAWEFSYAREYLSQKCFPRWFSPAQQAVIAPVRLKNEANPLTDCPDAAETEDRLFLLSREEILRLEDQLPHSDWLPAALLMADRNLSGEGIEMYRQPCCWWLRTCGQEDGDVAAVEEDGSVDLVGKDSGCDEVGLRPAIWLDLDRIARLPELLRPDQL